MESGNSCSTQWITNHFDPPTFLNYKLLDNSINYEGTSYKHAFCYEILWKSDPMVWDSNIDYMLVSSRRWYLNLPVGYDNKNSKKATWNWNCNNIDQKVLKLSCELRISCPWVNYNFLYFTNKFLNILISLNGTSIWVHKSGGGNDLQFNWHWWFQA